MIKRLSQCIREYKKDAILSPLYVLVESLLDVAIPFVMAGLIDKGIEAGNMSMILRYGAILVGFALVALTFGALSGRSCARATAGFARNLRHDMFHHLQVYSFSNIDKFSSAGLVTRLTTDVSNVQNAFMMIIRTLIRCPAMLIFAMVMSFRINHDISLIFLAVIPILGVGLYLIIKHVHPVFERVFKTYDRLNGVVQENLSGIRVVQSFANEDIEHAKFKKSNEAFLLSKRDNYRCMGSFMSGNLFFQGMMYLVTLVYGGYLIANGEMQTADLAMYALYIGIFISPIQILVELVEMMQKGLSGFRRFLDVMETESEITDAPDARELTDVKGHVSYEHVSFHYSDDNTPVLSDISIDIPAGKSVALVGPSGGGKTTICSLLPRFYDVTKGRITVDGKDIRGLTLKSLRNNIGTVQQDVYLFDGTIRDNIAYGKPGASDEEIIAAAKRASIHDFIMELPQQYDTYVGERGTRLSGGQKQRISIARVFLKNPPILILDEATSALDNESERWIQRSLEELSQNRTTITIAHRLSTIRDADEIIVITEDGIAERGTHEELLDMNGVYAAYYNM